MSSVDDVYRRLGVANSYGSQYRRRLRAAGMIEPLGRGRIRFAMPYLREYLDSVA